MTKITTENDERFNIIIICILIGLIVGIVIGMAIGERDMVIAKRQATDFGMCFGYAMAFHTEHEYMDIAEECLNMTKS
jgi:xanthine/uracil permease